MCKNKIKKKKKNPVWEAHSIADASWLECHLFPPNPHLIMYLTPANPEGHENGPVR